MHLFTWPYNPKLSACENNFCPFSTLFLFLNQLFRSTKPSQSEQKFLEDKQNSHSQCNIIFLLTYCQKKSEINQVWRSTVSYFTKKSQIAINHNRWILYYFTSGFNTANENPYFLKLLCQCNTPMITIITKVIALLYCIFTNFTSCIKLLKSFTLKSVT